MKKLSILLVAALLLCLAACGAGGSPPPDPTGLHEVCTTPTSPYPDTPEGVSEHLRDEVFRPAFELYSYFSSTALPCDNEDTCEHEGMTYRRVTDPRFPTMAALEAAVRWHFSQALTREIMSKNLSNSLGAFPVFIEREGRLYTCMGDRGVDVNSIIYSSEGGDADEKFYKAHVIFFDGSEEDFFFTREFTDDRYTFTVFPMEWW